MGLSVDSGCAPCRPSGDPGNALNPSINTRDRPKTPNVTLWKPTDGNIYSPLRRGGFFPLPHCKHGNFRLIPDHPTVTFRPSECPEPYSDMVLGRLAITVGNRRQFVHSEEET